MTDYKTLFDQQAKILEIMTMPRMVVGDQLTVRDQFAMAALPFALSIHKPLTGREAAVDYAYKIADAMMEARK